MLRLAVSNRVRKHSFGWQWLGSNEEFEELVTQLSYVVTAYGWVRDGATVIAFKYMDSWYVNIA